MKRNQAALLEELQAIGAGKSFFLFRPRTVEELKLVDSLQDCGYISITDREVRLDGAGKFKRCELVCEICEG